jgi:hypothetical protein
MPPIGPRWVRRRESENREHRDPALWALRSPAWAAAIALHLVAAVVLMNVVDFVARPRTSQIFKISLAPPRCPEPPGGARQSDQDNGVNGRDSEDGRPAGPADTSDPRPRGVRLPEIRETAPSLPLGGSVPLVGDGPSGATVRGGLFAGRGGAGRGDLLRRHGGGDDTERAVADGLDWLARHQAEDGSWGGTRPVCPHLPECSDPGCGCTAGVTGFALLAFLGHGHTHQGGAEDPHAATVDRARRYLLSSQTEDGTFGTPAWPASTDMYGHAAATMAIAELFAMSQDPRLRKSAQSAVDLIAARQQPCGGWDYYAGNTGRGDASISALVVQALRSARAAGLMVPRRTWSEARKFYDRVFIRPEAKIVYDIRSDAHVGASWRSRSLSSAGFVARRYLGLRHDPEIARLMDDFLRQGALVFTTADADSDPGCAAYFTYYATLHFFCAGGPAWTAWNSRLKAGLLPAQARAGCARGSWDPDKTDAAGYGRPYLTALCVLALESYYRYLPSSADHPAAFAPLADAPGEETPALIRKLEAKTMEARRLAAKAHAERDEPCVFESLAAAARREKTSLRELVVRSLGGFEETPERRACLEGFLVEAERPTVRDAARAALAEWDRGQ